MSHFFVGNIVNDVAVYRHVCMHEQPVVYRRRALRHFRDTQAGPVGHDQNHSAYSSNVCRIFECCLTYERTTTISPLYLTRTVNVGESTDRSPRGTNCAQYTSFTRKHVRT